MEIRPPLGLAVFWGREAAWVQVQLCNESYKLVGGGFRGETLHDLAFEE